MHQFFQICFIFCSSTLHVSGHQRAATWVNTTRYCKYSQVLLMMGENIARNTLSWLGIINYSIQCNLLVIFVIIIIILMCHDFANSCIWLTGFIMGRWWQVLVFLCILPQKLDPLYVGKLIPWTQITGLPLLTFKFVDLHDGAYFRLQ